jgi:hypothetical protein
MSSIFGKYPQAIRKRSETIRPTRRPRSTSRKTVARKVAIQTKASEKDLLA